MFLNQLGDFVVEDGDEFPADDLPLRFRIGDAGQLAQEAIGCVDSDQIQSQLLAQVLLNFGEFVFAQDSIVDEDTGQPRADGFVYQHGGDGGIHTAGKTADGVAFGADGFFDRLNGFVDETCRSPIVLGAADAEDKIAQQVLTVLGVVDLRMELDGEDPSLRIFDGRDGCIRRTRDEMEAGWQFFGVVAVRHPDIQILRNILEEA